MHPARPQSVLRICEGRSRTLRCKRGTSINIIQANYGRLTGGQICPGQIKTTYCRATLSLAKVNTACQRKLQCFLRATNSIYGDPCKGTRKYLEVGIIQLKIYFLDISSTYSPSHFIVLSRLHFFNFMYLQKNCHF